MSNLKQLSKEAIPNALEKAMRYRLLNEPWHAESICLDILEADPGNQQAAYIMILAITDQFGSKFQVSIREAREKTAILTNQYEQFFCNGLIFERQATSALRRTTPRAKYIAFDHLTRAMEWYQKAEEIKPDKNDDAILRWNSCARLIKKYHLEEEDEDHGIQPFLDV